MKKFVRYLANVKKEIKKVRWPKKKEMITYSIATLSLTVLFMLFFVGSDAVISMIVKVFS